MGKIKQVSFAQQRLWFLDQLEPGNVAYNLVCAFRILGLLDEGALSRALGMVIARHEPLRTVFRALDGRVMAVVGAAPERIELTPENLDVLPEDAREEHALGIAAGEARQPFDLSRGPLIRFKLLRLSPDHHMLVMTMHHIVMDGWSIRMLLEEMGHAYEAFCTNRLPALPPFPLQYSDFAAWQRESFDDEAQTRQLHYWKRTLDGAPEVLDLPADRLRPAAPKHQGRRYTVRLDTRLTGDVLEIARQERITPFMLLLAAFQTLLWRYTGVGDFVIGTATAGRSHLEVEPLIGLFVNTIPLRANLGDNPEFRVLLQRIRQSTLDALANQDFPFEKLIEELRPRRSMSYAPLFQTMFIVHNTPRTSFQSAGIHVQELEVDGGSSKFDLTVELYEEDGLCCTWEYDTDLFDHARIVRMAEHFETLLRGICADPHHKLSELPLLTPYERNKILIEWNETDSPFPDDACIHEAFEDQAAHSPDSIAVIDEDRRLTYGQLNREANRLAHYLQRHGVEPGDRVGVAMERSTDAIVSLLAVMKTGASFVAIDPAYPTQRNEFMLQDSGARVLITRQRFGPRVPHAGHILFLDSDRPTLLAEGDDDLRVSVDCRGPAYVIYTSGSTGQPKGVLGTHRASMNRLAWMWKTYPFGDGEISAQRTTLSFVDAVAEIFGPLLKGVPLAVLSAETVVDPEELVRQLARRRITRIVLVPSLLNIILEEIPDLGDRLSALRFCFVSGEALPYGLFLRFGELLPRTTLVNLYGSSEVAADVTFFDCSNPALGFVPIGKPIANVRIYLLDPNLNPVPIGVPGEIHVGGECLAGGYLDRPELTGSRFVPDPFRPGGLLFKTGDLGRYGDNGNIEFLGRQDNQIKIRGFRIEPSEIEAALKSHGSVGDAVVLLSNRGPASRLTAYVVPHQGQTVAHADLRRHLKNVLPDYMVPAAFITLDALPMTPNGKLDQLALSELDPAESRPSPGYAAPRNELEKTVLAIWSEVLKIERIGVFDDFFELGGHSLLAAQVIARIRKHTEVEVPLRSLFEEPTAAALAKAVEKARASGAALKIPAAVPGTAQRTRSQLEERLRDLSDEELDVLLNTVLTSRQTAGSADG